MEVKKLWNPIKLGDNWKNADTSILDEISTSWVYRREILKENSSEYKKFLERLKREHAIETGVIERIYDLERGVTETLIKEGFHEALVSHGDSDIPKAKLFAHLNDHIDAIEFVYDVVGEERDLTIGFIHQLHHLTTRNQETAEGRDQFGNRTQIPLLKGKFKERPNNPTLPNGTSIQYCPPEHVAAEMDKLIALHDQAIEEEIHPLIRASWFHHSFAMIHPYQDGNGRVGRLLSSLILIKAGLFPLTVRREESKMRYIKALEKADKGEVQPLVTYFGESQKTRIERALNLQDVSGTSNNMMEVARILGQKAQREKARKHAAHQEELVKSRQEIFDLCLDHIKESEKNIQPMLNGSVNTSLHQSPSSESDTNNHYKAQIIKYAKKHDYFFNHYLPTAFVALRFHLDQERTYQLIISLHHYGYDDQTLAIGAFLEPLERNMDIEKRLTSVLPLDIKPHVMSVATAIKLKEKNIKGFLDQALTLSLAHIASEI